MTTSSSAKQRTTFRAEQVGSLLRPARLLDALEQHSSFSRERDSASDVSVAFREADHAALREIEDDCIREAVERQIGAGVDVLSDGEFRRVFFMGSFDSALSGLEMDMGETIDFHRDNGETVTLEGRPYVARRLEKVSSPGADEAAFLKEAAGGRPFKVTFPAASSVANPGAFRPGVTDSAYSDPMEMVGHMLQLLRELIDDAVAAGAEYIQMDYPGYVLWVDEGFREIFAQSGIPLDMMLEGMLMADSQIVQGLPDHVHKALHICRGNYRGTWMVSGSLEPVAERVFNLPYDSFLIEWEDSERMGDFSSLRHVPKGPVVAMGLVSTKTPELESEDDLLRQLDEAAKYVDMEQLALCPQCGFASEAAGNPLSEDDQWRKLELVARVADRVWPR
jgi:5-methyltetrahydropteroyltriglutamate--homocysteine methyltransferase